MSRATRGRAPQRTVLVLQREPLFVVGRGSFVDEMLAIAGGENLGRALAGPYPRASVEWLVDAAPEVLLDASDGGIASRAYWSRWSSLPAVASGRVLSVSSNLVTFPGPHLDRALRALAEALQGPGVRAELEGRP